MEEITKETKDVIIDGGGKLADVIGEVVADYVVETAGRVKNEETVAAIVLQGLGLFFARTISFMWKGREGIDAVKYEEKVKDTLKTYEVYAKTFWEKMK